MGAGSGTGAVRQALQLGALSLDAIKHLLLCHDERRPARLDLEHICQSRSGHHSRFRLPVAAERSDGLMDTPRVLSDHDLKVLRLSTFVREYGKVAQQCADESVDYPRYLFRLTELEPLDRERRASGRRNKQARSRCSRAWTAPSFWRFPA